MKSLSLLIISAASVAAAALAGCGAAAPTSNVSIVHAAGAPILGAADLERQLASGVREGLSQVAVMQQPADGATDLGQDLPEGLVRTVRCAALVAGTSTTPSQSAICAVDWKTATGSRKHTAYAVRLTPGRCFVAQAQPSLRPLHDSTIQTYSEHPLNRITSLAPGC